MPPRKIHVPIRRGYGIPLFFALAREDASQHHDSVYGTKVDAASRAVIVVVIAVIIVAFDFSNLSLIAILNATDACDGRLDHTC